MQPCTPDGRFPTFFHPSGKESTENVYKRGFWFNFDTASLERVLEGRGFLLAWGVRLGTQDQRWSGVKQKHVVWQEKAYRAIFCYLFLWKMPSIATATLGSLGAVFCGSEESSLLAFSTTKPLSYLPPLYRQRKPIGYRVHGKLSLIENALCWRFSRWVSDISKLKSEQIQLKGYESCFQKLRRGWLRSPSMTVGCAPGIPNNVGRQVLSENKASADKPK